MKAEMNWKLVRDRIPAIMEAAGTTPVFRTINESERMAWLLEKLREEVSELLAQPCLEECADVLEVVVTIARHLGHAEDELRAAASDKVVRCGSFDGGVLLRIPGREDDPGWTGT
jgi:predicted house-cleaning noncanonical NTP pyrophosphatase (MazG superfamily)